MLDQAAITTAIVNWIMDRTGMDQAHVMLADQNAPQPAAGKFITVKLGTVDRVGRDQHGPTNDQGIRTRIGNREIILTIHGFRDGSREVMDNIADGLDDEPTRDKLRGAGIAIWNIGNVLNMTLPVEKTMRQHYVLEVDIRVGSERTENVGYIAQVELEATTDQETGADIVEEITIGDAP